MRYLKHGWSQEEALQLAANPLSLLRYRSNLLGTDLRITNFGGGNTSSKITLPDPFTGLPVRVLAVKGSGGDLGSIKEPGFALLYLDRLEALKKIYRGEEHEDEMVGFYPLAAFGANRVAASIDTPLHAFLPFAHVDHLHPDWGIALAASANGLAGSTMFPRERVVQSLEKYKIAFADSESTEGLRAKLADFYAQRTLTGRPILPQDCARAILWLAGGDSAKTTGHVIPVDGGLWEAFLR